MFCDNCGQPQPGNVRFCFACGIKLPREEWFLPAVVSVPAATASTWTPKHFVRRTWQKPVRRVAILLVIIVNVVGVTSGVGLRPSILDLATTQGSTAATGGSPSPGSPDPAAALNVLVAAHPGADTSGAVATTGPPLAVVAYNATADVYTFAKGTWNLQSSLALDYLVKPNVSVMHADVTGDGRPDFLVTISDGDATFGSVISDQIRTWEVVPFQGTNGPEGSIRAVTLAGGHPVTRDAPGATVKTITWNYDANNDDFHSVG